MPNLLLFSLIFVISLATLIKASDFFTNAAEKFGILIGFSPFIVGVTIVSVGTSLPELISAIISIFQNSSEIVVSNVIGSNITNIFLIIAVASIIGTKGKPIKMTYNLVNVDLPLFVGSAFLLALTIWDKKFSSGEALLLIVSYVMYLFYTIKTSEEAQTKKYNNSKKTTVVLAKQILIIILSSTFIYLGARYTIYSIIKLSEILNIGKEIIAVSVVALGTSLPELTVTISAASKGKAEIAIGNVLGSNIFNAFIVMGIPGLISSLTIPETVLIAALPTMIAGTILLFFATQDKQFTIWEGWLFFIFYCWFIGTTFNLI